MREEQNEAVSVIQEIVNRINAAYEKTSRWLRNIGESIARAVKELPQVLQNGAEGEMKRFEKIVRWIGHPNGHSDAIIRVLILLLIVAIVIIARRT